MAHVDRTLNPDVIGGAGDGTGFPSYANAYSSAGQWGAAEEVDLVTATDTHEAHAISSGGTADIKCTITGWVTDSDYFVTFTNEDEHEGKRPTSTYRIDITDSFDSAFYVQQAYTVVKWLCASNKSSSSSHTFRIGTSADFSVFVNCIAYDSGTKGFNNQQGGDDVKYINCFSVGNTDEGFYSEANRVYAYNCVSVGNVGYGFYCGAFDDFYLKNCYGGGNTAADYFSEGTGDMQVTTCFSEDGTETTTTAAYATGSGCYFANVTATSEDVNLTSVSSSLYDSGTDLSADGVYPFDFDYADTARVLWNAGIHEYTAPGGTTYNAPLLGMNF